MFMEEYYYDRRSNSAYNDSITNYNPPNNNTTNYLYSNTYLPYNYLERGYIYAESGYHAI